MGVNEINLRKIREKARRLQEFSKFYRKFLVFIREEGERVEGKESKLQEMKLRFLEAILSLDQVEARAVLDSAGIPIHTFFDEIIASVMDDIGRGWNEGSVSLAQVYMCGRICEDIADKYLQIPSPQGNAGRTIAMGVLEDHHTLGKRIVMATLSAAGVPVQDLGSGLTAQAVVEYCEREQVQLLLLSTLMLRSAMEVATVRKLLKEKGKRLQILVGGAPINLDKELWKVVGADNMAKTAAQTVELVQEWLTQREGTA